MAGTKEIKRRIKSIKNTKKITKAMELVAASKMKRAVASTLASRLYSEYSWEVLDSVAKNITKEKYQGKPSLFEERPVKNILFVLITSNRGLCGAYNAQVIKRTLQVLAKTNGAKVELLTIGKKGDMAMRRVGQEVVATFPDLPDNVRLLDVTPISKFLNDEFIAKKYDRVLVAYTDFHSPLVQKPNVKQVLPVSKEVIDELKESIESNEGVVGRKKVDYLFEGDIDKLTEMLAEKITRMQIYQMLLESRASEQSARMIAMKNASEASGEMIDDLTLAFNKARQSNITREISEISAGMASVS